VRPSTVIALLRLGSLVGDHWEQGLQEILRVASDVLDVARINYWRFRTHPPSIICELGYLASAQTYERGFVVNDIGIRFLVSEP